MLFVLCLLTVVAIVMIVYTSSRKVTFASLILWTISAMWFQPWKWFAMRPSPDPELDLLRQSLRKQAWWWTGISLIFLIVAMVIFLSKGTRKGFEKDPQARPEHISTQRLIQIICVLLFIFGAVFFVFVAK